MKIGIVCGYGIVLDDILKGYLTEVVDHCRREGITKLILSGGRTSTRSSISEAQVMHDFIHEVEPFLQLFVEDKALTTLHNLLYSKNLILDIPIIVDELTIFCDRVRYIKVCLISLIIFNASKTKIKKVWRKESAWIYLAQMPSTINHLLGAISPSVEKRILMKKEEWIKKYR